MSRIDLGDNILKPTTVAATVEGFYQRTDDEKTGRICSELADLWEQKQRGELKAEEYKKLKDEKKRGCHFYTPHAHFKKGYKRSDGEPVDSGKSIIDLDGCLHFKELYEQHLKGRERELGINMVNHSVTKTGGHVLFDIPEGMTREEAQAWMAHEMGDATYDKAVHERERAVYIPCREYILYIDEELMFGDELHPATVPQSASATQTAEPKKDIKGCEPIVPSERTRFIAEGVMKEKGLEKSDFLDEGGRHTSVKVLLSGVTQLLTKEEVNGVLQELMPQHWQDENIQTLVSDFYKNYTKPSQRLTRYQEQLFVESRRLPTNNYTAEPSLSCNPPEMPRKLPKLVALLTSKTPDIYKAAVAHAVFPPLATHLCEVRFPYTDGKIYEATLMNCLMAGTGAG